MKNTILLLLVIILSSCSVSLNTGNIEEINLENSITEIEMGSFGIVECGNYKASLEYVDDFSNAQSVIDKKDKAAYMFRAGEGFIADHNHQGAEEVKNNDILYIISPNNTKTAYKKVETIVSEDGSWFVNDRDIFKYRQNSLLFQTCNDDDSVSFIFFEKIT